MRWPDLEKHERFGVATMDPFGLIMNCNGAFAGHVGTDVTGATGTWLRDHISKSCKEKLKERLDDLRESRVSCASFNVEMTYSSSMHAIEIVCFGKPRDENLWLLSFELSTDATLEIQSKLQQVKDQMLDYFMSGNLNPEVNINTTNITGDQNQSVQSENVDNASQDN